MRLLLDTHLLVWASHDESKLSAMASSYIGDAENELHFSVVSVWEIAIKHALRRDDFYTEPKMMRTRLLDAGYLEVPLTGEHAVAVSTLPLIHRDPFDRVLVAQALTEGMTLVTADAVMARYPGAILKV